MEGGRRSKPKWWPEHVRVVGLNFRDGTIQVRWPNEPQYVTYLNASDFRKHQDDSKLKHGQFRFPKKHLADALGIANACILRKTKLNARFVVNLLTEIISTTFSLFIRLARTKRKTCNWFMKRAIVTSRNVIAFCRKSQTFNNFLRYVEKWPVFVAHAWTLQKMSSFSFSLSSQAL